MHARTRIQRKAAPAPPAPALARPRGFGAAAELATVPAAMPTALSHDFSRVSVHRASHGAGPIQRVQIQPPGASSPIDVDDEELMQGIFDATLAHYDEVKKKADPKEVGEQKLTSSDIPGLVDFPGSENVGTRPIRSMEEAMKARAFGQANPASKHTLRFERPGRKKENPSVRNDAWEREFTMEPQESGFHTTTGGTYGDVAKKMKNLENSYLQQVKAEDPKIADPSAEARRRMGRLTLGLMKEDKDRRFEHIPQYTPLPDPTAKKITGKKKTPVELKGTTFEKAADVMGVTTMAEGHRNLAMMPLSLMAHHQVKHGADPQAVFGPKGTFAAADTGTEQKLRAIHTYYALKGTGTQLSPAQAEDLKKAQDVHDKMKQQLATFYNTPKVLNKSLPKTNVRITDPASAKQAMVEVVKRKFLRVPPQQVVTNSNNVINSNNSSSTGGTPVIASSGLGSSATVSGSSSTPNTGSTIASTAMPIASNVGHGSSSGIATAPITGSSIPILHHGGTGMPALINSGTDSGMPTLSTSSIPVLPSTATGSGTSVNSSTPNTVLSTATPHAPPKRKPSQDDDDAIKKLKQHP